MRLSCALLYVSLIAVVDGRHADVVPPGLGSPPLFLGIDLLDEIKNVREIRLHTSLPHGPATLESSIDSDSRYATTM